MKDNEPTNDESSEDRINLFWGFPPEVSPAYAKVKKRVPTSGFPFSKDSVIEQDGKQYAAGLFTIFDTVDVYIWEKAPGFYLNSKSELHYHQLFFLLYHTYHNGIAEGRQRAEAAAEATCTQNTEAVGMKDAN